MSSPEPVQVAAAELARLRAIEEAARWHLANSACRGWEQGNVLALALGVDPTADDRQFARLLRALGIEAHDDPLWSLFDPPESDEGKAQ